MKNLISSAITKLTTAAKKLHVKQLVSIAFVSLLLLTANIDSSFSSQGASKRLDEVVHQDDSQRPKTTGEWNQEARETKGNPGEKLNRIGKQSAQAVKDFASIYPDTAQRSASDLKNSNKKNN